MTRTKLTTGLSIFDLDPSLKPLVNDLCWEASWCESLSLSFSIGNPRIDVIREPTIYEGDRRHIFLIRRARSRWISVNGEWNFRVSSTNWRVFRGGKCVAGPSSKYSARMKSIAVYELRGQRLVGIYISKENGTTRFEFDLDTVLEVKRLNNRTVKELWVFGDASDCYRMLYSNGDLQSVQC